MLITQGVRGTQRIHLACEQALRRQIIGNPGQRGICIVRPCLGLFIPADSARTCLKNASPEMLGEISEIRLQSESEVRILLSSPGPELRMRLGDAAHQCENYLAYRRGARMDWAAEYIDLRFENQVVVGR